MEWRYIREREWRGEKGEERRNSIEMREMGGKRENG